ncbi:MAG: ribosomal protein S18-alanine N-acetyltransferase [Lachnospiraceae bacterium]|nr:ribosomal protein S18-alanine N-acetyltransferase [Lachnospiraceae bacterium]
MLDLTNKNNMDIRIRKMEMKDIDAVCAMEEEAFSMPWHKESFIDMMNNPNALYMVAEDDMGVVCGAAGVLAVAGEGSICNIVVKADCRDRGIGRRLVQSMINVGRDEYDIKDYTLEVRESNKAARCLYERLGFICEGVRPGFYDKPKEDACIYWLRQ